MQYKLLKSLYIKIHFVYENRYFLAFDEGEDVNVIIFNNIEEILGNLIDSYLALDKKD